jgi:hypothetical protein
LFFLFLFFLPTDNAICCSTGETIAGTAAVVTSSPPSPSPGVSGGSGKDDGGTNGSGSVGTGTKRRKMADLRAFVETRLLSRSDHRVPLDKTDNNKSNASASSPLPSSSSPLRAASPPKTLLTAPEIVSLFKIVISKIFLLKKSYCRLHLKRCRLKCTRRK